MQSSLPIKPNIEKDLEESFSTHSGTFSANR